MRYPPNLRLRVEREQRKWSRSYMAEKLNLGDPKTIGRWERGIALPSPHFRRKLCELFALSAEELGLASPGVATSEAPPSHPALPIAQPQAMQKESPEKEGKRWHVPYRRNPFFTGRQDVLASLHTVFFSERLTTLSYIQALSGLGGIGKTHIAIEYAYRFDAQYSGIYWVQADTRDDLISSCTGLLDFLGHSLRGHQKDEDPLRVFSYWLSRHTRWLLIIDNIEDLTLLQHVLPTDCQGHVLLTTRIQSTGSFARCLPLDKMTDSEGALFLLRRVKRLEPDATLVQSSPADQFLGQKLSSLLGGLPLALDQAGAYIEEAGCSISDYLQRYTHQRASLLDRRGMVGKDHPRSVATTFSLAYTQVRQKLPLAADLLCLCAFLAADGIPEELFLHHTAHPYGTENTSGRSSFLTDLYQFDQAIAVLRNFSLVQRQPEMRTISLHRLVQVILQERMSEQEQAKWYQSVVHLLNAAFPAVANGTGTGIWESCERLLPHVMTCATSLPTLLQDLQLAELLLKAADYLDQQSQYERAKSLYQQALQIQVQGVGLEHPAVGSLQSKLAYLYRLLGDYKQAEHLFQSAEHLLEQAWGPGHPEVAFPLEGLAMVYYEQGKYDLALPLQQRALQIREQAWGSEHPDVALSLNRLGNVYMEQGKYDLAEQVYQRALQIREQIGEPMHFRIVGSLNNLGYLYREQGKYEQAEALCQRAVRLAEQVLGANHPDVAVALETLAGLYRDWGKYEQAELLYQRAYDLFEQALGPEHHAGAYPLHGLALLYQEQGKYEQAETLFQRALLIRKQCLDQNHPEIAQVLYDLARLYKLQGKKSEASSLAERSLQIRMQLLGSAHPKTVASHAFLAQLEEA
ncbi:helix-turn-helix domain-containing protein [Ktedonosporobacter rubrisoli]|uniref:Helix-turn-helix domain-containing protein n=1 Tax=Ktedonosporobacter rubrisoli TaxID=2509675 RepID=A0A4P6K4H5_KTERU|nr:FxSxx-COOH system tetratricopeptide repeat protein [Ktedonosporobacter rubrisoli]QBD82862.1 helix-turn-helix domain-containing protein [Ktedonosporobacter rubrisoli]